MHSGQGEGQSPGNECKPVQCPSNWHKHVCVCLNDLLSICRNSAKSDPPTHFFFLCCDAAGESHLYMHDKERGGGMSGICGVRSAQTCRCATARWIISVTGVKIKRSKGNVASTAVKLDHDGENQLFVLLFNTQMYVWRVIVERWASRLHDRGWTWFCWLALFTFIHTVVTLHQSHSQIQKCHVNMCMGCAGTSPWLDDCRWLYSIRYQSETVAFDLVKIECTESTDCMTQKFNITNQYGVVAQLVQRKPLRKAPMHWTKHVEKPSEENDSAWLHSRWAGHCQPARVQHVSS